MDVKTILTRNIENILPNKEGLIRLAGKKKIRLYLGIDPSGSKVHIGHAVVLWKMRQLQDAGHKIILLIGDFTGMIGDPTDKTSARKKLTRKEVLENAKTYKEQVGKILNFAGSNPAEFRFNSEWLSKLNFGDVVELASNLTVQQMLERDFFQVRLKENKPIHLHEFLYPLMQGYDSLAMDVDAEIGGTDQTFNMLVGRTLMKALKNKEKFVISVPLLEGLDGRKMSKSFNNYVGVDDVPTDMFGKIMSLNDSLIDQYFQLATNLTENELRSIKAQKMHPMEAKKRLAWEIVKLYHDEQQANKARQEFEKVFQKGSAPEEAQTYKTARGTLDLVKVLTENKMVKSNSEARRLIEQGGVEWNGEKVTNITLDVQTSGILRIGKHRFLKVEVS